MERLGHLRAVEVVFTAGAVLHEAHELKLAAVELREGFGMQRQRFIGQLREGHPRHTAGGAGKGGADHVRSETDGLKNLSAVIARQQ